ncbi:hypothetical protein LINPERHAP1_LOCUS34552 [Linum perenne]
MWEPAGHLHIVDLDRSCFLVKFSLEQDYFKALTGGPWVLLDHYLIVHQWDQSFRVSNDMPQKMVVWVRFPHLPLHLYHGQVLNSLGNLIGKTVKIDFNTQKAERGKFARIAIEIDLNDPLPPVINLDGAFQKIECENLPTLCFDCGRIGHVKEHCPKNLAITQACIPTATPLLPRRRLHRRRNHSGHGCLSPGISSDQKRKVSHLRKLRNLRSPPIKPHWEW